MKIYKMEFNLLKNPKDGEFPIEVIVNAYTAVHESETFVSFLIPIENVDNVRLDSVRRDNINYMSLHAYINTHRQIFTFLSKSLYFATDIRLEETYHENMDMISKNVNISYINMELSSAKLELHRLLQPFYKKMKEIKHLEKVRDKLYGVKEPSQSIVSEFLKSLSEEDRPKIMALERVIMDDYAPITSPIHILRKEESDE